MGKKITDIKKALLERIITSDSGCWEWQKSLNASGYGVARWKDKKTLAHRISFSAFVSKIPSDMFVLHKCDNRKCINPDHLFLGTSRDNRLDQIAKGRDPAKNATHCKAGHPFSGDNLFIQKSGRRRCLRCKVMKQKEWKDRMKKEREVLPGDDSLRVSRSDWKIIREILMKLNQGDSITGDIIKNVERIERESKGE